MKHIANFLRTALDQQSILEWEEVLPTLQMAYNSAVHKATKMTPFQLLYGMNPRTPSFDPNLPDKIYYGEDYVTTLKQRMELARRAAKKNGLVYREKYEEKHNEEAEYNRFKEGDLVLLHRPELAKVNPKLCSVWDGPYAVLSLVGLQNALVQHIASQKTRFVHVNRLKPYISRPGEVVKTRNTSSAPRRGRSARQQAADAAGMPEQPIQPRELEFTDTWGEWLPRPGQTFPQPKIIPKNEPEDKNSSSTDADSSKNESEASREASSDSDSQGAEEERNRIRPQPQPDIQPAPSISGRSSSSTQTVRPKGAISRLAGAARGAAAQFGDDLYETIVTAHLPTTRRQAKERGETIPNVPLPSVPLEYRGRGRGRGQGRGRGGRT